MQYRWGFIEEGIFVECKPIVDDATSLDYAQESGNMFYRAKLNGTLDFRFEYDAILAKGYNYTHIVVLQYYDNDNNDWVECWRGRFTLTDCDVNCDTHTISVKPETIDNYTKILDHLADEYNLLKLNPTQKAMDINIRPCCQLYSMNDSKLVNAIGGITWEQSCASVSADNIADFKGTLQKETFVIACWFTANSWANFYNDGKPVFFIGTPVWDTPRVFELTATNIEVSPGITIRCAIYQDADETKFTISLFHPLLVHDSTTICSASFERQEAGTPATYWYSTGSDQYCYVDNAIADWQKVYERWIINNDGDSITIAGLTHSLIDIPADDMAGSNLNYNKIINGFNCTSLYANMNLTEDTTQYGESLIEGWYFTKDTSYNDTETPIGQGIWRIVSLWSHIPPTIEAEMEVANYKRTIRDCYTLPSVIYRLMKKADNSLVFADDPSYSQFLFGTTSPLGFEQFYLTLTPKSNIISSYYNTPAQKAPITLSQVFDMLKILFNVYWYIDENKHLHLEHISYFQNGLSYAEDNQVLLDLDGVTHTRTMSVKDFGQNQYRFDKGEMPAVITYEYADIQTIPFTGYPMKAKDAYVQQGTTLENQIGAFSADVDYLLASPEEASKEGFALLAAPVVAGQRVFELAISEIEMRDEDNVLWRYKVQNLQCAIGYLSETFLRYNLPCENWLINNDDATAITTGNYKQQSVEYADLIMAEIIADTSNCIQRIRTQQGDGIIKSLSINLNSLSTKADLLFNFIGRWFYLRGTALGNTITIFVDGQSTEIDVEANTFLYRYNTPMSALNFNAADVVSVDFTDCDNLNNLTSAEDMFKNCSELIAVNFGHKTFGAVTDATDMFAGCAQLTTLICPNTSTWKPDISFEDCSLLTTESVYSLIDYLFVYESGTHTITFNQTMWNALEPDVQADIEAKANAKGWMIGMAATYFISGQSPASVVYATINGNAVEIDVENGVFNYGYRNPITSLSFQGDANVTDIDFSLSDGLAGLTLLDNAFKNCSGLTSVDFTGCDLSNVISASDTFANCSALYTLEIPTGTWKPDIDLSASVMPKTEMLNVIDGLFTYNTGTHTITFNSTIWDAMSVADQQIVFDAADAKGWTTNAVAVIIKIKGTSSNVNGTETFNVQFIDDGALSPSAAETITCAVDSQGNWEFSYSGKKIYSLNNFCNTAQSGGTANTTLLSCDFSEADDLSSAINVDKAFYWCTSLTSVTFGGCTLNNCLTARGMFARCTSITNTSINWGNVTFASVTHLQQNGNINDYGMFQGCTALTSISLPFTFQALQYSANMFRGCTALTSVSLPNTTFASGLDFRNMFYGCSALTDVSTLRNKTFALTTTTAGMFYGCNHLTTIDLTDATFASLTGASEMFYGCSALSTIDLSNKTFSSLVNASSMFRGCSNATTIDLSSATFGAITNASGMFYGCSTMTSLLWPNADLSTIRTITGGGGSPNGMFRSCSSMTSIPTRNMNWNEITNMGNVFSGCKAMTSINTSSFTFAKMQIAYQAFEGCTALTNIDFSAATFGALTNAFAMFKSCTNLATITWSNNLNLQSLTSIGGWSGNTTMGMFEGCTSLTSLNWSSQTLPSIIQLGNAFRGCTSLVSVNFSSATFANVTTCDGMFASCQSLVSVDMTSATFASVTQVSRSGQTDTHIFGNCTSLSSIIVTQNATAISTSATSANGSLNLHWSPLTYTSMNAVAIWLCDLTGLTPFTITYNATAWNALSTAEQNTIDGILSGKNWTRAIA